MEVKKQYLLCVYYDCRFIFASMIIMIDRNFYRENMYRVLRIFIHINLMKKVSLTCFFFSDKDSFRAFNFLKFTPLIYVIG